MKSATERAEWLKNCAWERQKLGLSVAEYNSLTPFEIKCELEALKEIESERKTLLKLIDEHLSRIEILLNGFNFPSVKTIDDLRMLKTVKKISSATRRRNEKKNFEMNAKLRKLVNEIKAKRDGIRKARADKWRSQ